MSTVPEQKKLAFEEIASALTSMGVDPDVERIAALQSRIDPQALQAGDREAAVRFAVGHANRELEMRNAEGSEPLSVQIVKPDATSRFNLRYPYILAHEIPYAPAIPGTDMGEQMGGTYYWKRGGGPWNPSASEAQRYSEDIARKEQARQKAVGKTDVELVDANVLEARLCVMVAVGRMSEDVLPRSALKDLFNRVRAIPDEYYARAVPDLAKHGTLTDPLILTVTGLGAGKPGVPLEDEEVVGLYDGHVVQWDATKSVAYTSGETLEVWGVHNLKEHELRRVGVTRERWQACVAEEAATVSKQSDTLQQTLVALLSEVAVPGGIGEDEFSRMGGWLDRAQQALAGQPIEMGVLRRMHELRVNNAELAEQNRSLRATLGEISEALDGCVSPITPDSVDGDKVEWPSRALYLAQVALGEREMFPEPAADMGPSVDM